MADNLDPVLEILTRPESSPEAQAAALRILGQTDDPNVSSIPEGTISSALLGGLGAGTLGYLARPVARLTGGELRPDVKLRHLLRSIGQEPNAPQWLQKIVSRKGEVPTLEQLKKAPAAKKQRLIEAAMAAGAGTVGGAGVGALTAPDKPDILSGGQMDEAVYDAVLGVLADPNATEEAKAEAMAAIQAQGENMDTGLSTFGKGVIGSALGAVLAGQLGAQIGKYTGKTVHARMKKKGKEPKPGLTPAQKGHTYGEAIGDLLGGVGGGIVGASSLFNRPENREFDEYVEQAAAGNPEAAQALANAYDRTLTEAPVGEYVGSTLGTILGLGAGIPALRRNELLLEALKEKRRVRNLAGPVWDRGVNIIKEAPEAFKFALGVAPPGQSAGGALMDAFGDAKDVIRDWATDQYAKADRLDSGPKYKELMAGNAKALRETLAEAGLKAGIGSAVGAAAGTLAGAASEYRDPFATERQPLSVESPLS